jgi:hypothetical protein
MRPSVRPVTKALEAYSRAIEPTPTLIHDLTRALAEELAGTLGGTVEIRLPGNIRIIREHREHSANEKA